MLLGRAVRRSVGIRATSSAAALVPAADLARVHAVLSDDLQKFNLGRSYTLAQHLAHVSVFAQRLGPLLAPWDRVVDLGAGSGILGFVSAFAYPDARFILMDNRESCCDFMLQGTRTLGLEGRVDVLHLRAESAGMDPAHRQKHAGVMARRFNGGAATAAECSAPLLQQGGFLLVSDPSPDVEAPSARWPPAGLQLLGLTVERHGDHHSLLRQSKLCGAEYPRSRRLKRRLF